jgi:hypothetical protein
MKKKNKKNPVGCPSKYNPLYCKKIIEYFDVPCNNFKDVTITHKDGSSIEKTEEEAAPLLTLNKFAKSIGVWHDTLLDWCKKYPEFDRAYNRAKEFQREFIIENILRDNYSSYFGVFLMKNMFGWRDKTDIDLTSTLNIEFQGKTVDDLQRESEELARKIIANRDGAALTSKN